MTKNGQNYDQLNEAIAQSFLMRYVNLARSSTGGPAHEEVMAFCRYILEDAGISPRVLSTLELLAAFEFLGDDQGAPL